jgi:hypothetical protein
MFVRNNTGGYTRRGDQWAKGDFLMLCQEDKITNRLMPKRSPIRGIVRPVRMDQVGHWMMGMMRVGHYEVTLSGTYGSDGLVCSVPPAVYRHGLELPEWLVERWNTGGGHNSAGHEAGPMREWANQHIEELTTPAADYDRTICDEIPDLDNPDSYSTNFMAIKNVDEGGVSYAYIKAEWILEAFWAGGAAYKFVFGSVRCQDTKPIHKLDDMHSPIVQDAWRSLWWDSIHPALDRNGWTNYVRDPHTKEKRAPNKWLAQIRYNAGFNDKDYVPNR